MLLSMKMINSKNRLRKFVINPSSTTKCSSSMTIQLSSASCSTHVNTRPRCCVYSSSHLFKFIFFLLSFSRIPPRSLSLKLLILLSEDRNNEYWPWPAAASRMTKQKGDKLLWLWKCLFPFPQMVYDAKQIIDWFCHSGEIAHISPKSQIALTLCD